MHMQIIYNIKIEAYRRRTSEEQITEAGSGRSLLACPKPA